MKLVTYIDGFEVTPYGVMLERHSISCHVAIKKEHQKEFIRVLEERLGVEFALPTDRSKPVPVVFSTDELSDLLSDHEGEEWLKPYYDELIYMSEEDPCGMGIVYVMGSKA